SPSARNISPRRPRPHAPRSIVEGCRGWRDACAPCLGGAAVMRPFGLLAILAALTFSGCATRIVSSHVELNADFATYRTYDWEPADAPPTGDAGPHSTA